MQDYTSLSHSTLCKRLAAAERKLCGLKYALRASKRGSAPRWKPKSRPWQPVGPGDIIRVRAPRPRATLATVGAAYAAPPLQGEPVAQTGWGTATTLPTFTIHTTTAVDPVYRETEPGF